MGPADIGRVTRVGDIHIVGQYRLVSPREFAERSGITCRKREHVKRPVLLHAIMRRRIGRLFQDDMRVATAETERTDPCQTAAAILQPWSFFNRDGDRQTRPVDMGISRLQMQICGNRATLQRENYLGDAGDPCCRLQMADVGLDRADDQRPFSVAA
jgi:hypothetical protein